jgi:hypothetical protein
VGGKKVQQVSPISMLEWQEKKTGGGDNCISLSTGLEPVVNACFNFL